MNTNKFYIDNQNMCHSIARSVKLYMPQIDGVRLDVETYQDPSPLKKTSVVVRVCQSFEVEIDKPSEMFEYIGKKLHEITCNGQVKLELEKY